MNKQNKLDRIKNPYVNFNCSQLFRYKFFRYKKACIGAILILFAAAGVLCFTGDNTTVLLANDTPLAVVAGPDQVQTVLKTLKKDLEQQNGIALTGYATNLSYENQKIKDQKPVDDEKLAAVLKDNIEWQVDCAIIYINGKPALYLSSTEEAQKTLENVKAAYIPQDSGQVTVENVSFTEEVNISKGSGLLKDLQTPEAAIEAILKGLNKTVQHNVVKGDTLWTIARANNMTVEALKQINTEQKDDRLKLGQKLNLVKSEPLLTVMATITTTQEEKIAYSTVYESDSNLWRGQQTVKQEGTYGSRQVSYRITVANDKEISRETLAEKILTEPVSKIVKRGAKAMIASRSDAGNGILGWPIRNRINSGYGQRNREMHTGIDIDGNTGDPICAAENGTVIFAGRQGNYGNMIIIDHGNGMTTRYAHLNTMGVPVGQTVVRAQVIGTVGTTGRSTGSHLHFEVRINGAPKNPLQYLER